jgi:hypothetical protein
MKPKEALRKLLLALGGSGLILIGIFLAQSGFGLWDRLQGELVLAQEQLGRFQGWLAAEPQVVSRREELLGPLARVGELDFSWVALQNLQEAAQAQGLIITELRPTQVRRRGSPPLLRLDAKVEGRLTPLAGFLQQLPQILPGVELDNLQLHPEEARLAPAGSPGGQEEQVQGILRLLLPFPAFTGGEP